MQAGLFLAVSGGIREAVRLYSEMATASAAGLLHRRAGTAVGGAMRIPASWTVWPEQTLVGILRAAEAMP